MWGISLLATDESLLQPAANERESLRCLPLLPQHLADTPKVAPPRSRSPRTPALA